MSNMSYCRFRNTLGDLNDCLEALEHLERWSNLTDDEKMEYELSSDEMYAARELVEVAKQITEMAIPETPKWFNVEDN